MGFFDWLGGLFRGHSETVQDVADRLDRVGDRCAMHDDTEGEGLAREAARRARLCTTLSEAKEIEFDLMNTLGIETRHRKKPTQGSTHSDEDSPDTDDS